ncbi:hypothetical protein FHT86_007732 [Rhizobium sp. BK313]|jgi:hypothetical protein|nr:hypothetical protein [Rhizobium sp. BK313]
MAEIISDHPDFGKLYRAVVADEIEERLAPDEADERTAWAHRRGSEQ